MQPSTNRLRVLTLIIIIITTVHCSDPDEPAQFVDTGNDTDEHDTAVSDTSDTGDTDADDVDATSPEDDADTSPDENFEKPDSVTGWTEGGFLDEDDIDTGETGGGGVSWGLEHMKYTPYVSESWLYEDEYFVRNGYFHRSSPSWDSRDLRVLALFEGERLPFRLIQVTSEGGFPTLDEIESWNPEEFVYSESITVEDGVPFNYTIAIPPWAFPGKGAHNIQILFDPRYEPGDEDWSFLTYFHINRSHTIYYGSELLENNPNDHRVYEKDEVDRWEKEAVGTSEFAYQSGGSFLAPPLDIYDWTIHDRAFYSEMNVILESSSRNIELNFYHYGLTFMEYDSTGQNLYYILQDGEIIDTFLFAPGDQPSDAEVLEGKPGYRFPIDIELPRDETTEITVYWAPQSYEPFEEWFQSHPMNSNTLKLQHVTD